MITIQLTIGTPIVWYTSVIGIIDNWHTKGHTDSYLSNIMARYIIYIPRPKSNISDIDTMDNCHSKGHTNALYPRS